MRATVNLDDDLLGEAQRLTGMTERTPLIHEACALSSRARAPGVSRGWEPPIRNRREYEGDLHVDERLLTGLINACKAVAAALDRLPPVT